MKLNLDLLFKLSKSGAANDVVEVLGAIEQISGKASSIAKSVEEMAGQAKVVVKKVQSISEKVDKLKD